MAVGAAIGLWRARVVEMTQMPELVAMLHSFVGLAAVLVGYSSYLESRDAGTDDKLHLVEVFLGVFIGAVTFTGSIVAFLKLSARIKSSPLMLPARHWLNLAALVVSAGLLVWFVQSHSVIPLLLMTVIALAFGWHLVASIGGGDMPVVVSMLNSYSGWAAAAAGFMLGNDLLIVTGALVGLLRCDPQLHHVQGDEPLVLLSDRRRVRPGGVGRRRQGLRRAPRDDRRRRRRAAARRLDRGHHPGLRHGGRAGAVPRRRADRRSCARRASTSGSGSTRSRVGCPAT